MGINFAHTRERSPTGGWIDYVVFEANTSTGLDRDRADLLLALTGQARALGLHIDQAALAYRNNGRLKFYAPPDVVAYLAKQRL